MPTSWYQSSSHSLGWFSFASFAHTFALQAIASTSQRSSVPASFLDVPFRFAFNTTSLPADRSWRFRWHDYSSGPEIAAMPSTSISVTFAPAVLLLLFSFLRSNCFQWGTATLLSSIAFALWFDSRFQPWLRTSPAFASSLEKPMHWVSACPNCFAVLNCRTCSGGAATSLLGILRWPSVFSARRLSLCFALVGTEFPLVVRVSLTLIGIEWFILFLYNILIK